MSTVGCPRVPPALWPAGRSVSPGIAADRRDGPAGGRRTDVEVDEDPPAGVDGEERRVAVPDREEPNLGDSQEIFCTEWNKMITYATIHRNPQGGAR